MPRRQTHNPFTRGISYVFASWIYFNAAYTRSTLFTADGASLGSMPSNEPQVEPINLSVLREAAHGSFTLAALDTSNADIFHAPLTYDDWNTPTVTATASQTTTQSHEEDAILSFAQTELIDFQQSGINICNKIHDSITTRIKPNQLHYIHTPSEGEPRPFCSDKMPQLMDEEKKIGSRMLQDNYSMKLFQAIVQLPRSCSKFGHEIYIWLWRSEHLKASNKISTRLKATHCDQLARRVMHSFMQSNDPSLNKHTIARLSLRDQGSASANGHSLAVVFKQGQTPSSDYQPKHIFQLAEDYPDGIVIDLWNHITFELSSLLKHGEKSFKAAVTDSFIRSYADGKQLSQPALAATTREAKKVAQQQFRAVRHYYTGFKQCVIELQPKAPSQECRPTLSR